MKISDLCITNYIISVCIYSKELERCFRQPTAFMTAKMTEDAAKIYDLYQLKFAPKWFTVFFILSEDGEKKITEIASNIGHSQPSVTKIFKEMIHGGLVQEKNAIQ